MTERWKPEFDEMYWNILADGEVILFCWRDDEIDRTYFNFGNCFRTEEEAEAAAEKVKDLLLDLHESPEEPSQGLGTSIVPESGQVWVHRNSGVYYKVLSTNAWFSPEPRVTISQFTPSYFNPITQNIDGRDFLHNYVLINVPQSGKGIHDTPDHYKLDPEPIDVIKAWGLDFCKGNVIKYVARAGRKTGESEDSDLHKAMNYLRLALEDEK